MGPSPSQPPVKECGKATATKLRRLTGYGKTRVDRLLARAVKDGDLNRTDTIIKSNPCEEYSLPEGT